MSNRRADVLQMIPAELAILDITRMVEHLGCDERLTDAVILLSQARDKVADWAEATGNVKPEDPVVQA